MKTNLVIVEGLPGCGKSTTAAMIADELKKKGKRVVCADEGTADHPADYADYDFSDFGEEREKILGKWRRFVQNCDKNTIYVFNCVFLQNPMCETMMRFGMDIEQSRTYIAEIAEIIRPLHPVVIYIDRPDAGAAIRNVLAERGDEWLNAVTDYHVSQGYGKQNGLSGHDGYIKCLEERRIREINILRSLDIVQFTVSRDITAEEFGELYAAAGWKCPAREYVELAIRNSTCSFVVRQKDRAVAMIHWLGDLGMHWFMKDFIVHPEYQGQMIGTLLCRFSENFIRSTLHTGQKVCIDLRSFRGKEGFYRTLGYNAMTENETGAGMEKMLEK